MMVKQIGTSREQFIRSVRACLGRDQGEPVEPYKLLNEDLSIMEARVKDTLSRLEHNRDQRISYLAQVAKLRGWQVHRAGGLEEAVDYIRSTVQELGAKIILRSNDQIFDDIPVDQTLHNLDANLLIMTRDNIQRDEINPVAADLGLTGVDYAIAETGTAVIAPRMDISRLTSLLPPVHIAIVKPSQILDDLDDLYLLRRWDYYQRDHDMGSYLNFITGPSRTADIEQTLVIGAHGPRETHMIIMDK